MNRTLLLVASMLVSCAARQLAPAEAANGWKPVEVAEIHGRCYAAWVDRGLEQSKANAMCSCVVPQLTDRFSFAWFNDGRDMTPSETAQVKGVEEACVREFVKSAPQGTGSPAVQL